MSTDPVKSGDFFVSLRTFVWQFRGSYNFYNAPWKSFLFFNSMAFQKKVQMNLLVQPAF